MKERKTGYNNQGFVASAGRTMNPLLHGTLPTYRQTGYRCAVQVTMGIE